MTSTMVAFSTPLATSTRMYVSQIDRALSQITKLAWSAHSETFVYELGTGEVQAWSYNRGLNQWRSTRVGDIPWAVPPDAQQSLPSSGYRILGRSRSGSTLLYTIQLDEVPTPTDIEGPPPDVELWLWESGASRKVGVIEEWCFDEVKWSLDEQMAVLQSIQGYGCGHEVYVWLLKLTNYSLTPLFKAADHRDMVTVDDISDDGQAVLYHTGGQLFAWDLGENTKTAIPVPERAHQFVRAVWVESRQKILVETWVGADERVWTYDLSLARLVPVAGFPTRDAAWAVSSNRRWLVFLTTPGELNSILWVADLTALP